MPRALSSAEGEALQISGSLLKFASENVKDLPKQVVSTIMAAEDAKEANQWEEAIATEFWLAFNSLCTIIKPGTVDTIATNLREVPVPKWKVLLRLRQAGDRVSLAQKTARRYLESLSFLLILAVVLGCLVATTTRLSGEIEKLITTGNELTDKMVSETDELERALGSKDFNAAGADQQRGIASLQKEFEQLNYLLDQILQKNNVLTRLYSFGFSDAAYEKGTLEPAHKISDLRDAIKSYYVTRRDLAEHQLRTSVYIEMLGSSVLPIILGLMGACAYVVRSISEQIKEGTFSSTSPVRHQVRVLLGGLAGVVIGFGGVVSATTLSPSALAFIAGYAVEPVFATFDSIAEKFRR